MSRLLVNTQCPNVKKLYVNVSLRSFTVIYQSVHRQKYRHCSPGRHCGEDFPQGTGTPPPGLETDTYTDNTQNRTVIETVYIL